MIHCYNAILPLSLTIFIYNKVKSFDQFQVPFQYPYQQGQDIVLRMFPPLGLLLHPTRDRENLLNKGFRVCSLSVGTYVDFQDLDAIHNH